MVGGGEIKKSSEKMPSRTLFHLTGRFFGEEESIVSSSISQYW